MKRSNRFILVISLILSLLASGSVYAAQESATASFSATLTRVPPTPPTPTPTPTPVGPVLGITGGSLAGAFSFFPTLSRFLPRTAVMPACPVYTNPFFNEIYGDNKGSNLQMAQYSYMPMRIAVINEDTKLQIKPESVQKALASSEKQPNIILYEVNVGPHPMIKNNPKNLAYINPQLIAKTYDEQKDRSGKYRGELVHTSFTQP